MTGEFAAIESIRALLPGPCGEDQVWIGDDAAVVPVPDGGVLLLAADSVVAGIHADLGLTSLADLGWKAMAACVSDIAAMGGLPRWALVTVAGSSADELRELYEGIAEAARSFECPVVGGDLTDAPSLVITVAVTGSCDSKPVLRGGARPGDDVWVTGPLGRSSAGLRLLRAGAGLSGAGAAEMVRAHARPLPRLAEGRAARAAGASAMIDVSDGFAADVSRLAHDSGVGISLDVVPSAQGATSQDALSGGEDFELVFCAPRGAPVEQAFTGMRRPLRIGACTDDHHGVRLDGARLPATGWEHRL